MGKSTSYAAKKPDENGYVNYTEVENQTWKILYERQLPLVEKYACPAFMKGLQKLNFSVDKIAQLPDVSGVLQAETGWEVYPVAALINYEKFFRLLSEKKFPAATFIRRHDELEYLTEPDIFHELFGHCPLLCDPDYAQFMQKYGELGLSATDADRHWYARIYWYTVEFGLLKAGDSFSCYGGGILSSIKETPYAVDSNKAKRLPLNVLTALRSPYRIDILQTIYFYIEELADLFTLLDCDFPAAIVEARELGQLPPTYTTCQET